MSCAHARSRPGTHSKTTSRHTAMKMFGGKTALVASLTLGAVLAAQTAYARSDANLPVREEYAVKADQHYRLVANAGNAASHIVHCVWRKGCS